MRRLLVACLTTLLYPLGTVSAEEKCSCADGQCPPACRQPAPQDVVSALKNRFPDIKIDQGVEMLLGTDPPEVTFHTPPAHVSCRVNRKAAPIKIDHCHVIRT